MSSRGRLVVLLAPAAAALAGLAVLQAAAPDYLFRQGFPLDDAWIHAVYARAVARTFALAYNPGAPATGETSPLWALVLALPHAVAAGALAAVRLSKALGFVLHAAAACALAAAVWHVDRPRVWLAAASGALVAAHPDLVAASVSGMEVPLAALISAATILATVRRAWRALGVLGLLAFFARPESAVFCVLCPLLFLARPAPREALRGAAFGAAGVAAAVALMAVRNDLVSGLPLPATFYVKHSTDSLLSPSWQIVGFRDLLGMFPLVNSPLVLAAGAVGAALCAAAPSSRPAARLGATLFLSGAAYCALSFVLVRPLDPEAFYHQRYVLPAVPLLVGGLALLSAALFDALPTRRPAAAAGAVAAIMGLLIAVASPARYVRLSNDARNIDDVQVEFGKALHGVPADANSWVIDAGASRYFGGGYVVDLMALNSVEMLGDGAQAFLDAHPPSYLDVFPTWSGVDFADGRPAPARTFVTSSPYTVTRVQAMRRHLLVACEPGRSGRIAVRDRTFTFRCAGGEPAS